MGQSRTKVKLYMFPGSNSVLTGQLMLDHKRVDYKLVKLPPGLHAVIMLVLGFETMGVPALKWGDRRVQGTRSISRALDELVPERPLFPSDPVERKAVEDAERWGEEFQNATRRVFYAIARRDRKAFTSVIVAKRSPPMRVFLRVGAGFIIRLATGVHRATEDAILASGIPYSLLRNNLYHEMVTMNIPAALEHGALIREDVALLPERLDQIDAWIAEGRLGGADLNAADFQIAANVSALLCSEDFAPLVAGRPAEALALRVIPEYGGHIGRVLPSEWLPSPEVAAEVSKGPGSVAAFLRGAGIGEAKISELMGGL